MRLHCEGLTHKGAQASFGAMFPRTVASMPLKPLTLASPGAVCDQRCRGPLPSIVTRPAIPFDGLLFPSSESKLQDSAKTDRRSNGKVVGQ